MAIIIRDEHLEKQIDHERERRGDATQAKTLGDLVRERLTQIEERARVAKSESSEAVVPAA